VSNKVVLEDLATQSNDYSSDDFSSDFSSGRSSGFAGTNMSSSMTNETDAWEGGWYIFEEGAIVGPLNSTDTFAREPLTATGQMRMVSRKGFSQWYPIKDFAEIYFMARGVVTTKPMETIAVRSSKSYEPVPVKIGPSPSSKILSVQQEVSSLASKPSTPEALPNQGAVEHEKKSAATFERQYLHVFSRLRLGRILSPVVGAFVYTPLTLGGYWWAWMVTASEEVSWHLTGASRMSSVIPLASCMIPGVHLIVAYLLARMVRQMEQQNGYQSVNPIIATILAIFPPFYMILIQRALNRHWQRHVVNSVAESPVG
jgi:hypothetical protein